MHAVDGGETWFGSGACNRHDVALGLLACQVAYHIQIVGALHLAFLVHFHHQGEFARFSINHVHGNRILSSRCHWSHPNMVEVVHANTCHTQKTAIRSPVERQWQIFESRPIFNFKAVNHTLLQRVGTNNNQFFLRTRHINDAFVHHCSTGTLIADHTRGVGLTGMHTVKNPLVHHLDVIHRLIGLIVGNCPSACTCHQGKHR